MYKVKLKVGEAVSSIEGTIDYIALKYLEALKAGHSASITSAYSVTERCKVSSPYLEKIILKKARKLGSVPSKFLKRPEVKVCRIASNLPSIHSSYVV